MAIDKILGNGDLDRVADSVFSAVSDSVSEIKAMQKRKAAENVQVVIQALKKIDADIREKYDGVTTVIEKRVATIKDGKDGRDGANGRDGKDGRPGRDGAVGPRGANGVDGRPGRDGVDGVSVTNANIDFDGSLIISLSNGRTINVGEVVAPDLADKIKVITNGGGTSQLVLDTLTSLQNQINDIAGGLDFQGTWDATTNTPALASGVGVNGDYYIVATAGSTNLDGITDWQIGDWLLFNGTVWQKIDQSNLVTSVNGYTGTVVLTNTDISGFGTMSTQNANAVAITGGTLAGVTSMAIGTPTADKKLTVVDSSQCLATFKSTGTNGGGITFMDADTSDSDAVGIGANNDDLCFRSGGVAGVSMTLTSAQVLTGPSGGFSGAIGLTAASTGAFTTLAASGDTILSNVNVIGASYDSVSFSVAAQETTVSGLFFSPDGLKMYVIGTGSDNVNEYNLSTAWVVSSAVFATSISVNSQDGAATGVFFRADGTKMYMLGSSNDSVYQYTLSTPWSVATASYDSVSFSVGGQETSPNGIWFKPNGLSMYVVGSAGDAVYQYTLSTAWDVSTATFLQSFSVSGQEGTSSGVTFTGDGSRMFVTGTTGDDVNVYNLTTPWDVSTSAFVGVFSVSGQDTAPADLYIKPDGTKMYILGNTNDTVFQYTVPSIDIQLTGQTSVAALDVQQDLNVYGLTTFTANPVISGGTANGVAYLNGSKVLTTGSALTFDGTNFGIGTSSPTYKVSVNSAGSGETLNLLSLSADGAATGGNAATVNFVAASDLITMRTASSDALAFGTANTERLRIDSSGNVGIGTSSPAYKLDVSGGGSVSGQIAGATRGSLRLKGSYAGTTDIAHVSAWNASDIKVLDISTTSDDTATPTSVTTFDVATAGVAVELMRFSGAAGTVFNEGGLDYDFRVESDTNTHALFVQGSDGNVGIGTSSPSYKFDVTGYARATTGWALSTDGSTFTPSGLNAIPNYGTGYITTDSRVSLAGFGGLLFYTQQAERARIDSSGNLLIGTTSASNGAARLDVVAPAGNSLAATLKNASGAGEWNTQIWNAGTSGDNAFVQFATETSYTGRGSISYNRAGGLVAYNTTSDYRAKDIIGPVTDSGALIDSTPVYMGKMKGATQERPMFIAHETPAYAHTGEKDAVDADGNPVYQQMDASALIPVMWAEIQSLRQRLAAAGI